MILRIHSQLATSSPLLRLNHGFSSHPPLPRTPSSLLPPSAPLRIPALIARSQTDPWNEATAEPIDVQAFSADEEEEEEENSIPEEEEQDGDGFSQSNGFGRRPGEKDYDRDPEFADIIGTCVDDPKKAQARVEERIRKKRSKILHAKTGSPEAMKVTFNKFDFSNSYIWFEFCNAPLTKDIKLICDTIRSWHIIGRLGGCNSMNMQLSQAPLDTKRPSYDAISGANVAPTTFYNIGDLEIQDNLARIWVDIGTSEPLLLDVLINALVNISSDYVGIKQLVFGGSEFANWKENLTSEDAGYSTHKI